MLFFTHNGWSARLLIAVNLILLLFASDRCTAQGDENLEYKIKTAYLYNFTKFIIWPENNSPTFNICVVGNTAVSSLLASLEKKTALDKPVRIRYFDSTKQIADCHIAYFEQIETRNKTSTSDLLLSTSLHNTLTVSSQPLFAEAGGMIGFVVEDEKVKLHINLKTLKQQGLGISAKLIEVATLVEGAENE